MLSRRNTEYVEEYIKKVAESVFAGADRITVVFSETKYYVIVTKDGQMNGYEVVDEVPGINNSGINFVDLIQKVKERREREGW